MEEEHLFELIDKQHNKAFELCAEKFVSRKDSMIAFWSIVAIVIIIIGAAFTNAVGTSSTISKHEAEIYSNSQDISDLKNMRQDIKDIKDAVTDNKKDWSKGN